MLPLPPSFTTFPFSPRFRSRLWCSHCYGLIGFSHLNISILLQVLFLFLLLNLYMLSTVRLDTNFTVRHCNDHSMVRNSRSGHHSQWLKHAEHQLIFSCFRIDHRLQMDQQMGNLKHARPLPDGLCRLKTGCVALGAHDGLSRLELLQLTPE